MSKRRSKDQTRDYKCSFCAKTYLSYPALYTHLKNKHAKGPDGNPIAQLNVGRGRGRPKKLIDGVPATRAGLYRSHIEPNCPNFFKSLDKQGGPIFPDSCFEEVYTELYLKINQEPAEEDSQENEENEDNTLTMGQNELTMEAGDEGQANAEPVKKKRGRKPKSFYI